MLSILALAVSLIEPAYDLFVAFNVPQDSKPSFDVPTYQNLVVGPITTRFRIVNNGSATAHDVRVLLYFDAHSYEIFLEQYVPQIEQDGLKKLYFPVGYKQLELAWGSYGNYTITIWIDCKEVASAQQFEFSMF